MSPRLLSRLPLPMTCSAVLALVCVTLTVPPEMLAQAAHATVLPAEPAPAVLNGQQRVAHALNRLTFGPRPGEAARVERAGLDAWFEQQLHPATIDDSALERRLAAFPAMRLSQAALVERFPSPQKLRMMDRRDVTPPGDAVERAIYADSEAFYEARQQQKAAASAAKTADGSALQGASAPQKGKEAPVSLSSEKAASPQENVPAGEDEPGRKEARGRGGRAQAWAEDDVAALLQSAPEQRFARLVAMPPAQMLSLEASLRGPQQRARLLEGLTPAQAESVEAMVAPVRVVAAELTETRLLRDLYSERQLEAVMSDFWLNHFNIYARKNQNEPYLLPAFERDTIRPHAMGRFEDLLVATAQSPAMQMYLDNWQSVGPNSQAAQRVAQIKARRPDGVMAKKLPEGLNENYARELMELHTLGVNGGYTQADVIQVAKCLTGWTIERPLRGGEFTFEPARHEPGSKTVLGKAIQSGGENEGLQVLHLLASSPATAHFLSQKLAVRFVSDAPPPALVDRMAATYLKTDGEISAVLRTMFHSPEFWAPSTYRAKVKTPLEFVASAVRASDAQVTDAVPLVQALNRLGMPLYGMQTPNGYSWKAEEWVSSNALVSRMNTALVFSSGRLAGAHPEWTALLEGSAKATPTAGTASALPTETTDPNVRAHQEAQLERLLLEQPAGARTRAAVTAGAQNPTAQSAAEQEFRESRAENDDSAEEGGGLQLRRARAERQPQLLLPESPLATMAGLLLGSPEFQRR